MNKLNKILIGLVLVLILTVGFLAYWQYFRSPSYYAVFLKTGDLYFGRLTGLSGSVLKDVYFIRQNPNDKQNPFVLQKFSDIFWGPSDDGMKLNWDEVVWTAKLKPGQLVDLIKSGVSPQASSAANQNPQAPQTVQDQGLEKSTEKSK